MTHLTGFACPPVRRASRGGALYRKRSVTPLAGKQPRPSVAPGGPPGASKRSVSTLRTVSFPSAPDTVRSVPLRVTE